MTDPGRDLIKEAIRALAGQGNPATPEAILQWISRGETAESIRGHLAELDSQGIAERRAEGWVLC